MDLEGRVALVTGWPSRRWSGGGRVDVLVTNAASLGRAAYHDLDELHPKNFVHQLTVNVTAPFVLAKALVPAMRRTVAGWSRGGARS